jgi:hypothetical protein
MDVWYVCAFFCVYVALCLGRGLETSWSPVRGVLPAGHTNTEKTTALPRNRNCGRPPDRLATILTGIATGYGLDESR